MGIYGSLPQPTPAYLLDAPLWHDIFAPSDWYGVQSPAGGTLSVASITPNLPSDAIVQAAVLHAHLTAYRILPTGSLALNGNNVISLANILYAADGDRNELNTIIAGVVDPSTINVASVNTITWTSAPSGTGRFRVAPWLEVWYRLPGDALRNLRRGRRGGWLAGTNAKVTMSTTPSGDVFSWSPTLALPAGFTLRNALLFCYMSAYWKVYDGDSDPRVYGGQVKVTPPGGSATNVGAALNDSDRPLLCARELVSTRDGHCTPGPAGLVYDLRSILSSSGNINVKWNGIACNDITVITIRELSCSYKLWYSYAPSAAD